MKIQSGKRMLVCAATLLGAFLVSTSGSVRSFVMSGEKLNVGTSGFGYQRDVRVFNNALNPEANDNAVAEPAYPGALGAALSVWKAAKAWCSDTPTAAKNFDYDWQGAAPSAGGINDNVVQWGHCGGGTVSFVDYPTSDGWRITLCDSWTWSDGPGDPQPAQIDIQGLLAHELGHVLGLEHSSDHCNDCALAATMCPAMCGNGVSSRDISPDDAAGLEAIYGAIPASKPRITHLSGSLSPGQTLVIHGQSFAPFVNVKFTAGTSQDLGAIPGVLVNVPTIGGGAQIQVAVPAAAQKGNVLVWEPTLNLLSNGFPIDVGGTPFPTLAAPAQTNGGAPIPWSFTGPANHLWFLIVAIQDPTTFPFAGENYLLNAQLLFTGTLSSLGIGSQATTIPLGLGAFTFYSQAVTFDGASIVHGSNVTTTQNLF